MVSTRRSARKKEKDEYLSSNEEYTKEEYTKEKDEIEVEEAVARDTTEKYSGGRKRKKSDKRGGELRSKSTGVGIVLNSEPVNKKIVFGDGENNFVVPDKDDGIKERKTKEDQCSDESVDDDAVEEVKGSEAKDLVKQQLEQEHATARASFIKKPRKRKSKAQDAIANEFDDDFFKQLDEERAEERKQRQQTKNQTKPAGRHTTFVVSGDEEGRIDSEIAPNVAEHNIEVVVLGTDDSSDDPHRSTTGRSLLSEANKEKPSEAFLMYSRCILLVDGSEPPSCKQQQKAKKAGHKTVQAPTWKRSKKMNRILGAGRRLKGKAAAHFLVDI